MLIFACYREHREVASELVRRGAEVNKTNKEGSSALHVATERRNLELMKQLLVAGADPELKTEVYC